jgi:hypothetical protein
LRKVSSHEINLWHHAGETGNISLQLRKIRITFLIDDHIGYLEATSQINEESTSIQRVLEHNSLQQDMLAATIMIINSN